MHRVAVQRRSAQIFWLLAALIPLGSALAAPRRVAVLELRDEHHSIADAEAAYLADVVRGVAPKLLGANWQILTRARLMALLPPEADVADCADGCEVALGRTLGVDAVVASEVVRFGTQLKVSLRVLSSADGALIAAEQASAASVVALEPAVKVAALRVFGALARSMGGGDGLVDDPMAEIGPTAHGTLLMDIHEVTVAAFQACIGAGACASDHGRDDPLCNLHAVGRDQHPVNCVSAVEAAAYCRWRDRRLPTRAEWLRAATAKVGPHPWGHGVADCRRAVMYAGGDPGCGEGGTLPVGTRPLGRSAHGLVDLVGNVRECTLEQAATPPAWAMTALLGGAWHEGAPGMANGHAVTRLVTAADPFSGFRCARITP